MACNGHTRPLNFGTFNGGADNDSVTNNRTGGTFTGGLGDDSVTNDLGGTFNQEDPPA